MSSAMRSGPYVQKKEENRAFGEKDFAFRGDPWNYIAVERGTKLVFAFDRAKRNTMATQRFIKKLADASPGTCLPGLGLGPQASEVARSCIFNQHNVRTLTTRHCGIFIHSNA